MHRIQTDCSPSLSASKENMSIKSANSTDPTGADHESRTKGQDEQPQTTKSAPNAVGQDDTPKSDVEQAAPQHLVDDKPFSYFTKHEKKIIVFCGGICAFFSPISGQIYFPSLDTIAKDLNVSHTMVNLTITVYLVSGIEAERFEHF